MTSYPARLIDKHDHEKTLHNISLALLNGASVESVSGRIREELNEDSKESRARDLLDQIFKGFA